MCGRWRNPRLLLQGVEILPERDKMILHLS